MTGKDLKAGRLAAGLTQAEAAERLGVTQGMLSMVEQGRRAVSEAVARRVEKEFSMPLTSLPLGEYVPEEHDDFWFAEALADLGYPGFTHLRGTILVNPAELLMRAVDSEKMDARVMEGLPWVPRTFADMNWDWLVRNAKQRNRQNRLAYLVELSRQIAVENREADVARVLQAQLDVLERSRLAAEDTLCHQSMLRVEREWLRQYSTEAAKHWNLLSDLKVEHLDHARW